MFSTKVGIEIEFTGITRSDAADIAADLLNGTACRLFDHYDTYSVMDSKDRAWDFKSDSSIECQRVEDGRQIPAGKEYSVELVSPVLIYDEDIETLTELVRRLRDAGGFVNSSAGLHVHLNGADQGPRSIRNFINIIASRNDLSIKACK